MLRILPRRLLTEPAAAIERVETHGRRAVATLRIDGLVCGLCAARVERRLRSVPGVRAARVDLERSTACITFDPASASPEALAAAVEAAALVRPARRLLAALARFPAGRASARRRQAEACLAEPTVR